MPTIRTYLLVEGYSSEKGEREEFYLEANNNSEGEKTYEFIVRDAAISSGDPKSIKISLDMDNEELIELIKMLQVLVGT